MFIISFVREIIIPMKQKIFLLLIMLTHSIFAQKVEITSLPNQFYQKYDLHTSGDTISFYLTKTSNETHLPLVVYIQGSGWNSLFSDRNGRIVPTSGHSVWADVGREKYRILIVEKPGVNYLQTQESKEFQEKFSLETRSNTIIEAIDYVLKTERIDRSRILLAGHSEGGIIAARIARLMGDSLSRNFLVSRT